MSCYRPLNAYRDRRGVVKIGEGGSFAVESFQVPCGRCIGCKMDRARSWAIRISHEAQLYDSSRFATFTYSDNHLPGSKSLVYRHFQLFMKRLRKRVSGCSVGPEGDRPLRFFCAGEYGTRRKRPHFHAILFNLRLEDEVAWHNGSRYSSLLERLWKLGSVQLDEVNASTAAYVAGYCHKKVYGQAAGMHYEVVDRETGEVTSVRRPEFIAMSNRPGIGAWWYRRYKNDLFPMDAAVVEGKRWKVPRYYWERFRKDADPALVEELEYGRFLRAQESRAESTPERRAVREEVAQARISFFQERLDL